jgi:beta-fructofuranosidase
MISFEKLALSVLLFTRLGSAQSSTTAPFPDTTGRPVAGDYSGALRPQVHFSPPRGFMNDPNGLFKDAEGTFHLYYQYNPTELVAGNQHWGHATSKDMYSWTNQKIALFPATPKEGIFSGSAVIDTNNTSGFFPNQTNGVVAIYTLNTPEEQTQNIAYSIDNGFTFTKYSGNPVISINSTQFRDPQVTWHAETQKWVMVVAYSTEWTIGIFTSPNLRKWTHASNFTHYGLLGYVLLDEAYKVLSTNTVTAHNMNVPI